MAGARIQLKRATASSWSSNNPVLYAGEIGYETDTNKFKIGDGTTAYNSLAYFNGNLTGSNLNDLADVTITSATNGDFLRWNGSAWINDAVNLSTDTVGNYMVDVAGGTGVTVTHTPGEGSTASFAIGQDVATSASVTFAQLTVDGQTTVGGHVIPDANEAHDLGSAAARFRDIYLSGTTIDLGGATITSDGTDVSFSGGIYVGGSANFVGDLTGNADTATTLETARTISLGGDLSGSASFDGSTNITITAAVEPDSIALDDISNVSASAPNGDEYLKWDGTAWVPDVVALGEHTVGDYMINVIGGTGVSVSHTLSEGSTATVSIGQDVSPTASVTFDSVNITGNLTVSGTTTSLNTETLLVKDNIIQLNSNVTGSPSTNAGIEIRRGTSSDVTLRWNETTDSWELTEDGNTYKNIAIGQDVETSSSVTFAHVSADVTGDLTGNSSTATTLETARTISLAGDLSGSASFDGSQNISITATVEPNSVALGTDTTGNYVSDVTGGTGVTVTHTPGEGSSPSIAIGQAVGTSSSVTFAAVTAPLVGNASTASTLQTARAISLAGDLSGSVSFDGSQDVSITATVQPNSVALGTDTTGNYVSDVVAGTAITVTHTPGEGSSASIALNASLNDLNDVVVSGPAEFQTLAYDGSGWVPTYSPVVSYVRNAEATTLTTGTAVYLFGGTGDHASVKRADNSSDTTSSKTVGLVGASIASSNEGPVITRGYVGGINTSSFSVGDILWLGTSGALTNVKPSAPSHLVFIGVVVRSNANGIVYVATQNGYEIDELHNVKINGVTDGQFLRYNSSSALWVNDTINLGTDTAGDYVQNLVAGTGVTLTNNSGEGATPTIAIGQAVGTSASVAFARVETTGNVVVGGNLTVSGSVITENQESLTIDDPFIYLNNSSSVSNPDIGIAGNYNDGTYGHSGLFRDATDGKWKFFDSYTPEPSSPINTGHASYSAAPVVAETFESTVTTGTAPLTVASTTEVANLHADTASSLHTARAISLAGDLSGSVSFDGSGDVVLTAAVAANSVALGTDTTGNYMVDLAEGTGVTIVHTPGEGSTATVSIGQAVSTSSSVTFAAVTAPVVGNASTATTLQTARAISLGGDLSGSASFDGSGDITITAAVQANSVTLGTDTTGNYMSGVTAGTGVTVTHTPGEGSDATIAIGQAVGTSASVQFAQITTTGNVTVGGDLTVSGTTTTVNTETINLADNIIVLNSNATGAPSENAGLEIERGSSTNVQIRWNETSDKWEITEDGSTYYDIATTFYVDGQTITTLDEIGDVNITSASSGDFLKWNGTAWANDSIDLGTDTTGNYVSNVTGGTGVTVTHTPGEGSTPSIAIGQAVGTSSSVTFAAVSAPLVGNASTATTLQTARTIELTGDVTGSVSFNGSANASISTTIAANSVALGTDTTGSYVESLVAGTGVTLINNSGESATPTVAIGQSVATSASPTFAQITATSSPGLISTNSSGDEGGEILLYKPATNTSIAGTGVTIDVYQNKLRFFEQGGSARGAYIDLTATSAGVATNLISSAINSIDDISDVTITSATSGDFLKWNGTAWVNDPIDLGTDTTGNYMSGVTAGTGITITHTPGEGSNATIANAGVTSVNGSTGAITGVVRTSDTGTVTSTMIADGTIVNADINTSAAIALTKLAGDTTTALGVGSIEVGHATDTTITRVSAGKIAVEGLTVATTTDTRDVLVRFYMEVI